MIILFGVSDCDKCNAVKAALSSLGLPYDFLDANADENQKTADFYNVDELPHMIVTDEFGEQKANYIGEKCLEFIVAEKTESDKKSV